MDEKATAHERPRGGASAGAKRRTSQCARSGNGRRSSSTAAAALLGAMIEEMVEKQDADVTIFFYNPNIHPREYELRKEKTKNTRSAGRAVY